MWVKSLCQHNVSNFDSASKALLSHFFCQPHVQPHVQLHAQQKGLAVVSSDSVLVPPLGENRAKSLGAGVFL